MSDQNNNENFQNMLNEICKKMLPNMNLNEEQLKLLIQNFKENNNEEEDDSNDNNEDNDDSDDDNDNDDNDNDDNDDDVDDDDDTCIC